MLLTFPSGPVMVNIQLPKNVVDVNLNKYLSTTHMQGPSFVTPIM